VPALLVQWWGEKVIKCKSNTFNLADIIDRIPTNTCFTSRATVAGDGRRYSGRPVFIKSLNPRSFTIAKGRLLSATQRTISILGPCVIHICFRVSKQRTSSLCTCADDANRRPCPYRCVRRPALYYHFSSTPTWPRQRVRHLDLSCCLQR
jgi:hypothetical protein